MKEFTVIGAGIGGLTFSYEFLKRFPKSKLTIYEASDRVGGRVKTPAIDSLHINLGAGLILQSYTQTISLLNDLNIPLSYDQDSTINKVFYQLSESNYRDLKSKLNLFEIHKLARLLFNIKYSSPNPKYKTLDKYLTKYLGKKSPSNQMITATIRAFGFPDPKEIDTFQAYDVIKEIIQNGSSMVTLGEKSLDDVTRKLKERIVRRGGVISTNSQLNAVSIKSKELTINDHKIGYKKLLIATEYSQIHEKLLSYPFTSSDYSSLYSIVLKGKLETSKLNEWQTIFPQMDFSNDYTAILFNKAYTVEKGYNHDYFTIYIQNNTGKPPMKVQLIKFLDDTLHSRFDKKCEYKICKTQYWQKAIAKPNPKRSEIVSKNQGINDVYYLGDFTGISSIENSVRQANKIISQL
jgi:hypothetical protein